MLHNLFSYVPFSLDHKVLNNSLSSFKDILGLNYKAIEVMTISNFILNKSKFKLPGIYGIYCIAEGKFYIGQALNIGHRVTSHLQNRSSSAPLQQAFKKYGLEKFQIIVFNTLTFKALSNNKILLQTEINLLEQWFFDNIDPGRLYNSILSSTPIGSGYNRPHTDATKLKMKEISKAKNLHVDASNPNALSCKIVDITNENNVHYFQCYADCYRFLNITKKYFLYIKRKAKDRNQPLIINNWLFIGSEISKN